MGNQQFHVAQVHAFRNRVQFTEAAAAIPKTAILLEIGPHGVLRSPLRQCRPEASHSQREREREREHSFQRTQG